VLGTAGKDEKTEYRKGHRNDRILDPGSVEVHVRMGTIEGEQEEGWRQERPAEYPERPREPYGRAGAQATDSCAPSLCPF
jgi:hypothetical protein